MRSLKIHPKRALAVALVLAACALAIPTLPLGGAVRAQGPDFDWDEPFPYPVYLVHITETATMYGPIEKDVYILFPGVPEDGTLLTADDYGTRFINKAELAGGPFTTPREVCAATRGLPGEKLALFDQVPQLPDFNCSELESRPTIPDLVRDLEQFLAGQGVTGPTPGQAAAAGAATATLIAGLGLGNLLSGAKPAERSKPSRVKTLSSADPKLVRRLERRFQEMVDRKIKEGYYVRNPNIFRKIWNQTVGRIVDWICEYKGGQCGEFANWGKQWSEAFVRKIFGPGAIVDTIYVEERSSSNIRGFWDRLDSLYEANHAATRVILPTGERYVLDYWQAVSDRQADPKSKIRIVPENKWIRKWKKKIGEPDAVARNLHYAQEELKKWIGKSKTEEEAFELFRRDRHRGVPDCQIQTIINSWRRSPW